MARRRSRRGFTSAQRRKLVWATYDENLTGIAVGSWQNVDLLANYKGDGGTTQGVTIMRTHIRFWVTSSVTVGDGLAWGLAVMPSAAVTETTTADNMVPNPLDDEYWDWMYVTRENPHPHYSFQGAVDQWYVDLKAKRRLEELQEVYALSFLNADAAAAVDVAVYARVLLALP